MNVWLTYYDYHSEATVMGVHSSKERAEKHAELLGEKGWVMDDCFVLDPPLPESAFPNDVDPRYADD